MKAQHVIQYTPKVSNFMWAVDAANILARSMFPDHELCPRDIRETASPSGYSTTYTINIRDDNGTHVGNVQVHEYGQSQSILRMKAHGPSPALYAYQAGRIRSLTTTVYF